jgi:Mrp family chromosome partitioning ATPase/predicted Fe-Mo cluster-binding NifX family protein
MGCGFRNDQGADGIDGNGPEALAKPDDLARAAMRLIPHKVLVMSGKGGVGKTTVAVNLAYALAAAGHKVGIVDADMHGPDVPLMTGIEGLRAEASDEGLIPIEAPGGVRVLSVSSFLTSPDAPVIWRGPAKTGVIAQFLGLADWEGTEVLIVDCPPGTGDEPLSVAQMIPDADGVVIVTSPQGVSLLDSRKCVGFARQLDLPVLGIVENFSGFACPGCGRRIDLFKRGGGQRAAAELGIRFLGSIPITEAMVEAGDSGHPLVASTPDDPASQALAAIALAITADWATSDAVAADSDADRALPPKALGTLRLGVTAEDDAGLDAVISGHFGHAPVVMVVEVQDGKVLSVKPVVNPGATNHQPGQMPRFLKSLDVDVVLTGTMGEHAKSMFDAFGIKVVGGADGTVGQALNAWIRGDLAVWVPCGAHGHHGGGCGGHGHDHAGGGCGGHTSGQD